MRKTKAIYGEDARGELIKGIKAVHDAVAPTMGAKGRNAIYKKYGMPIVTNDGVSIAREIIPEDSYQYLGAESIKQASEQTNYEAGDGTSQTIVLAKTLIDNGLKAVNEGHNPMVLRREMEEARDAIVTQLKEISKPVDDLVDVARVSVEDEQMAQMVANIIKEVGTEGSVIVQESPGNEIRSEVVKGYTWESGYVSPYMITNNKGEAVLDNCAVIVTDRYLNLNQDLFKCLTELAQKQIGSVLVVADNVEGELLQTMLVNKQNGIITSVAVKRPQTLEALEDLAALTGATAVTKEKDIKMIGVEHVGYAERVIVKKDETILIGKAKEAQINERIEQVKLQIADKDNEKYGDIEILKQRLARLQGGIARIHVGANTEAEQAYKKMKIDDAVGACKAALEEGIVPGGGTTLRDLAVNVTGTIGGQVLADSLTQPYRQILLNAGLDASEGKNYNVLTGEVVEDLMAVGIVDPAKVVRCALQNAVSTAGIILTTESAIADIPDEPIQVVQG